MEKVEASIGGEQNKFQIPLGEKVAYVEIISLQNNICAVEIPGREAIFITRIRDKNNKHCWVSIPQGNNEVASVVGDYVDERLHSKGK